MKNSIDETRTVLVDNGLRFSAGDKITFEGVKSYTLFQRLVRLFCKSAFERTAKDKTFVITDRTETSIQILPNLLHPLSGDK